MTASSSTVNEPVVSSGTFREPVTSSDTVKEPVVSSGTSQEPAISFHTIKSSGDAYDTPREWAARSQPANETYISPFYTQGTQRLSLEGGLGIPTGVNHLSTSERTGPAVGAQYLYQLDDFWGIGVQAGYFHFGAKDHAVTNDTGGGLTERSTDDAATVEIMTRCALLPNAKVVPYIQSGLGLAYFHQTTDGTPLAGSTWNDTNTTEMRRLQNAQTVNFAYSIGLGVETQLTDRLILGLETTWRIFGVSMSTYGTSAINAPTLTLRLGWRFGTPSSTTTN